MADTKLFSKRLWYTDNSTISELRWENGEFECNLLEDTCRKRAGEDNKLQAIEKIYGMTAIPADKYEIKMDWSNHFKRKMPFLFSDNVGRNQYLKTGQKPYLFSDVMIHWANKPKEVLGCLATGTRQEKIPDWVSGSQAAYNKLEPKIIKALEQGRVFLYIDGGYGA
jgi:hypothetical protein